MKNLEMTVTIKVDSNDFQGICELSNLIEETNTNNEDDITLNLVQKMFLLKILQRLKDSGKRKACKLEAIGNEFINSIR